MQLNVNQPRLMDSAEVAEWLGVPTSTLGQWAYRGVGPVYMKVGRHRRYDPDAVRLWLDAQTRR